MGELRYRIGDSVWIREDVISGSDQDYGRCYSVNYYEKDIRGKEVVITGFQGDSYCCKEYNYFTDKMIDHDKTVQKEPTYEIY